MYPIILLGSAAFLLSLLLNLAIRFTPPRHRASVIPQVGGIPLAAAYLLSFALLLLMTLRSTSTAWAPTSITVRLLPAVALILAIGVIYDAGKLEPWHKTLGELASACLVFWAGFRIDQIGAIHLAGWSLPITILWIMFCCTATRWIGDVARTVPGVSLLTALTMVLAATIQHNVSLALVGVGVAAGLFGLMAATIGASTIPVGETGNIFLGVMLSCGGILWAQNSPTVAGISTPLLLFSLPLADIAFTTVRRFLLRRPLAGTDSRHIYYRPPRRGLSERGWAGATYLCCAIGAIASVLITSKSGHEIPISMFCILFSIYVLRPNYDEAAVAWRMLKSGSFHRALSAQIELAPLENQLANAGTPREWWEAVTKGLEHLGFQQARLSIAGSEFEWTRESCSRNTWEIECPITESDFVRLSRTFGESGGIDAFADFTALLRRSLSAKRGMFCSHEPSSNTESETAGQ
jgi:hypothetical protein